MNIALILLAVCGAIAALGLGVAATVALATLIPQETLSLAQDHGRFAGLEAQAETGASTGPRGGKRVRSGRATPTGAAGSSPGWALA